MPSYSGQNVGRMSVAPLAATVKYDLGFMRAERRGGTDQMKAGRSETLEGQAACRACIRTC